MNSDLFFPGSVKTTQFDGKLTVFRGMQKLAYYSTVPIY